MTSQAIMKRIEDERVKQGITCSDMDRRTWHSDGCYSKMSVALRNGGGLSLKNLIRYADVLGLELHVRKKAPKNV